MVARPLLRPPPGDVRMQAARVAALVLDRRRLRRRDHPAGAGSGEAAPVHPIGPLAGDPAAAAIAAAVGGAARLGRRLWRPSTLPAGLDPELDRGLAALSREARLAVALRCWLEWETPRIAAVLGRAVPDTQTIVAAALDALDRDPEVLGRHLAARARELRPAPPLGRPARVLATAAAAAAAVALAMFAGAASAPLPTVGVPPDLDLTLVDAPATAATYPPPDVVVHRETEPGEALAWFAGDVPPGVAFRWVVPLDGGFLALGVDPAAATDAIVRPAGFWTSPDGLAWRPLDADGAVFGEDDVVTGITAGPAGLVAVGGETYGPDALVRPAAWRLAPGASQWERAGLRTPPLGGPASIRQVYRDLSVVAAGGEFLAFARGGFAPTGRELPAGFEYAFDEVGVTLLGPGGATLERLTYGDIGLSTAAAARLLGGGEDHAAWRSTDGLRWEPVAVHVPQRLGAPARAAGRFWAATGGTLASSAEGQRWAPVDLGGVELGVTAVAGHPGGLVVATGDRTLVGADSSEWYTVTLPPAGNVFTGARWVAGGAAGLVAYGTMGSDEGAVFVPHVTVPGRDAVMEFDLVTGQLDVVEPGGAVRHSARYYEGGTFRADFAAGTFHVVDGFGTFRMTGRLDDWAAAVAAAHRTPYPPDGPIAVWYSADGAGWRLQEVGARGFPSAVAVGADRVVVAAITPERAGRPAGAQVWVGAAG